PHGSAVRYLVSRRELQQGPLQITPLRREPFGTCVGTATEIERVDEVEPLTVLEELGGIEDAMLRAPPRVHLALARVLLSTCRKEPVVLLRTSSLGVRWLHLPVREGQSSRPFADAA